MLFIFIVCCLLKDLFVFHFVRFVFATFVFDTIYIYIYIYIHIWCFFFHLAQLDVFVK